MSRGEGLKKTCAVHGAAAPVARCESCQVTMCDACYRFTVLSRPYCPGCAYELQSRRRRGQSLAVAFPALVTGAALVFARGSELETQTVAWLATTVVLSCVGGVVLAVQARAPVPEVKERARTPELEELAPPSASQRGGVYRARVRRLAQATTPRLSGRNVTLVVGAALLFSAVGLPLAVRLPGWLVLELVLLSWWAALTVTLSVLLYRGFRLEDDYWYRTPLTRLQRSTRGELKLDGGGCALDLNEVAFLFLALGLVLLAAWLLIELALPTLFLLVYTLLLRALSSVSNDDHGCEGKLGRSLTWGALWAFAYVSPLALATWIVAMALKHT